MRRNTNPTPLDTILQEAVDDVAWRVLVHRRPDLAHLTAARLARGEPAAIVAAAVRTACYGQAVRSLIECAVFGCQRHDATPPPSRPQRRRRWWLRQGRNIALIHPRSRAANLR